MSTAITLAPSATPIMTADRPRPPHPCTASQSPPARRPCTVSARYAVANRQPSDAAVTKSTDPGNATRFRSAAWIATRSAKEPGPVKPGWVWCGQTCASPARQYSHVPHPHTNGTVTRSPGRHRVTPAPTSATTPASSCPGMCGSATGSWPRHACQSDRHTPVARTASTTPPSGQPGAGTSVTVGSEPYSV